MKIINLLVILLLIHPGAVPEIKAQPMPAADVISLPFSRVIIYDRRGINRKESSIIIEQKQKQVRIWYQNHLGQRQGSIPFDDYMRCFMAMKTIKQFALRKKHRGRPLRRHAAKGSITMAWENADGEKEIRTIRYYAPENTLEDFRQAFNGLFALSRYAILSLHSFEHSKLAYREDAVYFMAGAAWLTQGEIKDVINHINQKGQGWRLTQAIWSVLHQPFSSQSPFNRRSFLYYCIKKCMLAVGEPAISFLSEDENLTSPEQQRLAREIINDYHRK